MPLLLPQRGRPFFIGGPHHPALAPEWCEPPQASRTTSVSRETAKTFGIMINYLYDPAAIKFRHDDFLLNGTVARSSAIDQLIAQVG